MAFCTEAETCALKLYNNITQKSVVTDGLHPFLIAIFEVKNKLYVTSGSPPAPPLGKACASFRHSFSYRSYVCRDVLFVVRLYVGFICSFFPPLYALHFVEH